MATTAVWVKLEESTFAQQVPRVCAQLAAGDVALDLSCVRRIDTNALRSMGELAKVAGEKKNKIMLRGVNVDVYKVLKLARLTTHFSFVD